MAAPVARAPESVAPVCARVVLWGCLTSMFRNDGFAFFVAVGSIYIVRYMLFAMIDKTTPFSCAQIDKTTPFSCLQIDKIAR